MLVNNPLKFRLCFKSKINIVPFACVGVRSYSRERDELIRKFQTGRIDEKRMKQLLRENSAPMPEQGDDTKRYSDELLKEINQIEPEFHKKGADEVELKKHYMKKTGELRETQSKEKIKKLGLEKRFRKIERKI